MAIAISESIIIFMAVQFVLTIRVPLRRVVREAESALEVPLTLTRSHWSYYGDITVGTAREGEQDQVFSVLFDTGSQHLWIASVDTTNEEDRSSYPFTKFDSSKSITFKKRQEPFEIGYMGGTNVNGHLAEETIKIVVKNKVLVLKNQVFGLAEHLQQRSTDGDGVFGLGLMQQTLKGSPDPPFITMTKQNGMEPVFGFYFNRSTARRLAHIAKRTPQYPRFCGSGLGVATGDASTALEYSIDRLELSSKATCVHFIKDKDGFEGGELNFGGKDEHLVEGEFTYHNVLKINGLYDNWYLDINKINIGKNQVVKHELQFLKMRTILDSGSNIISGPKVIVDIMKQSIFEYASFEVSKDYQFSCGVNWIELPDVTIVLDNSPYVLTPEDYVWGIKYNPAATCLLVFSGKSDRNDFSIGQPFMERYYTQFDMGRKRIGLARAKTPY